MTSCSHTEGQQHISLSLGKDSERLVFHPDWTMPRSDAWLLGISVILVLKAKANLGGLCCFCCGAIYNCIHCHN